MRRVLPRIVVHLRSNVLGLAALVVALAMTPLPSHANHLIVRTSDIVNGAVTRPKISDGAVNPRKLADGAVTTAKIRDGAVGTAKLADGAVKASQLGSIRVREKGTVVANGAVGSATAECEPGEVVLSGGALFSPPHRDTSIVMSFPDSNNGWRAAGTNESGDSRSFFAMAYCLRGP